MARCAVPARVQRAEQMLAAVRITLHVAPLHAAPTAQRAVIYPVEEDALHALGPGAVENQDLFVWKLLDCNE